MNGVTVSRVPILSFVGIFAFYVASHIIIGIMRNNIKKELDNDKTNKDLIKQAKMIKIGFDWYPFIFLVLVLIFVG